MFIRCFHLNPSLPCWCSFSISIYKWNIIFKRNFWFSRSMLHQYSSLGICIWIWFEGSIWFQFSFTSYYLWTILVDVSLLDRSFVYFCFLLLSKICHNFGLAIEHQLQTFEVLCAVHLMLLLCWRSSSINGASCITTSNFICFINSFHECWLYRIIDNI